MGSVTAKYSKTKQSVTRALYQHDYGQKLTFEGFDFGDSVEVHFCNKGDETTVIRFGNSHGVQIPDELLKTGKDIDAWIYMHDRRCNGESTYHVIIPVMKRGRVEDEKPDEQIEYILDGGTSEENVPGGCHVNEYIFDGRDSSDT